MFTRDGKLEKIEQRLTRENIARITKGTTKQQVRELLGPPWRTYPVPRTSLEEWDYRVTTDLDNDLLIAKPVILAAYASFLARKASQRTSAAGLALLSAVIFGTGAWHLLLGEGEAALA